MATKLLKHLPMWSRVDYVLTCLKKLHGIWSRMDMLMKQIEFPSLFKLLNAIRILIKTKFAKVILILKIFLIKFISLYLVLTHKLILILLGVINIFYWPLISSIPNFNVAWKNIKTTIIFCESIKSLTKRIDFACGLNQIKCGFLILSKDLHGLANHYFILKRALMMAVKLGWQKSLR